MGVDVKICGLTNRDDALQALDAGADYLGFILYAKSPRYIAAADLRRLLEGLGRPVQAVGVFVNLAPHDVQVVAMDCGLAVVQIHGDEAGAGFTEVTAPVWRALRRCEGGWQPGPEQWPAVRYVVDATVPGEYGGTGVLADWNAAAVLAETRATMLSGGLNAENVAEAVRRVRPVGVDVSSGVEASPGKKDPARVAAFIRAAKGA